jgi:hypothetical protein
MSTEEVTKAKKPFYKRIWFIVLASIVVLTIFFNAIGGDDTEDQGSTSAEAPTASTPVVSLTVPYVIGQVASDASEELVDLGFTYVTVQDESAEARDVESASNWIVCDIYPAAATTIESDVNLVLLAMKSSEPCKSENAGEAQVEEPESEPEVELTVQDLRESVFPIVFNSTRAGFIEVLTDLTIIESVDLYTYSPESGTVTVDATPTFDFDEGVRDDAWEVFRSFAGALYLEDSENGDWLVSEPRFAPNFRVTISTATYECDGEVMRSLASSMLSRQDWESTCRVR